jgi:hypothetical protein
VPPRAPAPNKKRSPNEIGLLYVTSAGYGAGLGIWLDAEIGISDPGVRLIPPAVLGVAAPIGVYFVDQPAMPRGMPAAIAAGLAIGGGEGLAIAGTQFVTADEADAWGFKGLSRSVAIGATAGGAVGFVVGYFEEPSPKLSAFASSGAFWGTAIGSSIGYGLSEEGTGYGRSNDSAAIGGLIGFNVGLLATGGLSTLFVPSWRQLGWMWAGAGIGAAASVPVFLFYAGEDTPPAKRGLIFTGTAIALGIGAAGVFTAGPDRESADSSPERSWASLEYVAPITLPGGAGIGLGGSLE